MPTSGYNSEKIYLGSDIDKLSDKSLSKVVEKVECLCKIKSYSERKNCPNIKRK